VGKMRELNWYHQPTVAPYHVASNLQQTHYKGVTLHLCTRVIAWLVGCTSRDRCTLI
jgi:hypothetical protein